MKRQLLGGVGWLLAGQGLQQFMQLAAFLLLARFLAPDVFGHVAMASVIVDVAAMACQWGLGQIILQRRAVTPRLLTNVFFASIAIALAFSLVILLGVLQYSLVYGFGLVPQLILSLIPILLFQAIGAVPHALLSKRMEFKWLAIRNNIAALAGGGAAVLLALAGMGVYALVAQKLIAVFTLSLVLWIVAGKTIRLSLSSVDSRLLAGVLKAGAQLVSMPVVSIMAPRAMDALIGVYLGAAVLGQFKIVWRIYQLIHDFTLNPVRTVLSSALPRLTRRTEEFKSLYLQVVGSSGLLIVPLLAGIALTAKQWVPLVLGEQWLETIPMFGVIAFIGPAMVIYSLQTPLLLSLRRSDLIVRQSVWNVISVSIITFVGVHWGVNVVLMLYVASVYALVALNWYSLSAGCGWSIHKDDLKAIFPFVASSVAMGFFVSWLGSHLNYESHLANLAVLACGGMASYAIVLGIAFRPAFKGVLQGLDRAESKVETAA